MGVGTMGSWARRHSAGLVSGVLLVAAVVATGFYVGFPWEESRKQPSVCDEVVAQATEAPIGAGAGAGSGGLNKGQSPGGEATLGLEIAFGRSRGTRGDQVSFRLPGVTKETTLDAHKEVLRREETPGLIPTQAYTVAATAPQDDRVLVTLCVTGEDYRIDPGTYTGTIEVSPPTGEPIAIPVKVSLQYEHWIVWAGLFGLLVIVAAPFFVWASGRSSILEPARPGAPPQFSDIPRTVRLLARWLFLHNFIAFFVALFAATSAFLATYWYNEAWGANAPKDWITLLAVMFTAFTTGLAAGSATSISPHDVKARPADTGKTGV